MRTWGIRTVVAAIAGAAGWVAGTPVRAVSGPDAALVAGSGWGARVIAGWLLLALTAAAVTETRRAPAALRRIAARLTLPLLRRVVRRAGAGGIAVVLGATPPALAAPAGSGSAGPPHPPGRHGGFWLDWPGTHPHPRPPRVAPAAPTSPDREHPRSPVVTVRPGDTLWGIAGRALPHPTAARIALAWPRWWQRNRGVIGPDPDLIRPGERLRPPAGGVR